jgi:hypothetical protein
VIENQEIPGITGGALNSQEGTPVRFTCKAAKRARAVSEDRDHAGEVSFSIRDEEGANASKRMDRGPGAGWKELLYTERAMNCIFCQSSKVAFFDCRLSG